MTNYNFNNEINATLQSIDGIARAEMPPFFYTRLQAKLQQQKSQSWWQTTFVTITKPAFSVITLSLFLALNITAITMVLKDKKDSANTSVNSTIQGFAQEYGLSVSSVDNDKTAR